MLFMLPKNYYLSMKCGEQINKEINQKCFFLINESTECLRYKYWRLHSGRADLRIFLGENNV